MIGFTTLLYKELLRFWKVTFQTICAPLIMALLYLSIFGNNSHCRQFIYYGISYKTFLVPGLVMMSILQNAFANSSSSLIQSKITGNLVFILLAPLTHLEIYCAYIIASVIRGLAVGCCILFISIFFVKITFIAPFYICFFSLVGASILGTIGLIAGIWAERFDHLSIFHNFFIMPLTFLAGVFNTTYALSTKVRIISHLNPFFYIIDGFRYGFFGVSDINPINSLIIVTIFFIIVFTIALYMLASGYKLRN